MAYAQGRGSACQRPELLAHTKERILAPECLESLKQLGAPSERGEVSRLIECAIRLRFRSSGGQRGGRRQPRRLQGAARVRKEEACHRSKIRVLAGLRSEAVVSRQRRERASLAGWLQRHSSRVMKMLKGFST